MNRIEPGTRSEPRKIAGASDRLTIVRVLDGYAYASNGNLHNPTPRYHFLLVADGLTVVDRSTRERSLRAAAQENGQAYLDEVDAR